MPDPMGVTDAPSGPSEFVTVVIKRTTADTLLQRIGKAVRISSAPIPAIDTELAEALGRALET